MWFNPQDLTRKKIIRVKDLHGYVLPHAGTAFTGEIISHTLRFRPVKPIKSVLILYYPASLQPDVEGTYFHEYYVPWQAMKTIFGAITYDTITYEGFNVRDDKLKKYDYKKYDLLVVSADFSHFFPDYQNALAQENKAAHALMFRRIQDETYANVVDNLASFRTLYQLIPPEWQLQWVGRTYSSVGYLSFLLREIPEKLPKPKGMFVTVYDAKMTPRECLGEWFMYKKVWTPEIEKELIQRVLDGGRTTSRLTGGTDLDVPLTNYTVTYLDEDRGRQAFIRGWHGILKAAFYLPEVFLENTYENGNWIKPTDKEWLADNTMLFNLNETLTHLNMKASGIGGTRKKRVTYIKNKTKRGGRSKNYTLFSSRVAHYSI